MTAKIYRSTDFGAPTLAGTAGTLVTLLDSVLVNGYGSLSITSLAQTGGVATATTASPHGYLHFLQVQIAGANESGYNGEVTATVTGANTFTYPVAGGTASPATGSITVSRPGSGWTKAFSGTNKAAYRQPTSGANGLYLRVDHTTTALDARFVGYETMSDVDTGTAPFPTAAQVSGGLYCRLSSVADGTARAWIAAVSDGVLYLFINANGAAGWATSGSGMGMVFGDFDSYAAGGVDSFGVMACAGASAVATPNAWVTNGTMAAATGNYIARVAAQSGTSATLGRSNSATGAGYCGGAGYAYPNAAGSSLVVSDVLISDVSPACARGKLRGVLNPLHAQPLTHGDLWQPGSGPYAGATYEAVKLGTVGEVLLRLNSDW